MHEKIVIIPIDDRPCHNGMIMKAMTHYDNLNIVYPPKKDLGHFTRMGNPKEIASFIERESVDADLLIVSIDSLLFGGLVQARTAEKDVVLEQYDQLLDCLRVAKDNNPKLKIYAYSVIMRLTTTVTSSENLSVWEDIFQYSQLVHRAQLDASYTESLETIENRIPADSLDEYLNARFRNHHINKQSIQFVKEKVIDFLVLVQEDTSSFGLHVSEQAVLKKMVDNYSLNHTVVIKNGTDEMVALLLARHINKNPKNVSIDSRFVDNNFVALYEDTHVLRNLSKSLEIANMKVSKSQFLIFMLPCDEHKSDLCFQPWIPSKTDRNEYLDVLSNYKNQKIGILDVKDANGGNPDVLIEVMNHMNNNSLVAYSAWNTASNSIGTLLLDMSIAIDDKTCSDYLRHRILDDAIYQGKVRSKIVHWMNENNFDIWSMNESNELDIELTRQMNNEVKLNSLISNKKNVSAKLPWGRSFEIEMEDSNE